MQAAFSTPGNFAVRNPDEHKLCGGFHPDYELRWSGPAGNYEMQPCLGCGEVDLYTPSGKACSTWPAETVTPRIRTSHFSPRAAGSDRRASDRANPGRSQVNSYRVEAPTNSEARL